MKLTREAFFRRTKIPTVVFTLIIALGLGLIGCSDDDNNGDGGTGTNGDLNAVETMQQDSDLSTFSQHLSDAGIDGQLEGTGPFTVFAPTNAAFDALSEGFMDSLDQGQKEEILNHHILSSAMRAGDVTQEQAAQTAQNDSLYLTTSDGGLVVNRNANVTEADIEASNAIIHKIDEVLLPDSYLDVYDIADKRYYTSLFACNCTSGRTGLKPVLKDSDATFTVFVPTNAAFEAIDDESLTDDELRNMLEYHIVETIHRSNELSDGQTLTTRNGADLTVSVAGDGTISLNDGAAVVQTVDLEGTNGVVHIIDTVLMPPHQ